MDTHYKVVRLYTEEVSYNRLKHLRLELPNGKIYYTDRDKGLSFEPVKEYKGEKFELYVDDELEDSGTIYDIKKDGTETTIIYV